VGRVLGRDTVNMAMDLHVQHGEHNGSCKKQRMCGWPGFSWLKTVANEPSGSTEVTNFKTNPEHCAGVDWINLV
jgi:hypothetical protein